MLKGQTTSAATLIDTAETSGVQSLDDEVINQLKKKHPDASQPHPETLLNVPFVDPVMFHDLDESVIARAAFPHKRSSWPLRYGCRELETHNPVKKFW